MSGQLVLIIGAGPTGLVLALWLTRLGVQRADHRQDRRAGNHLARGGRAGAHPGTLSTARPFRRGRRGRRQGGGPQPLGRGRPRPRASSWGVWERD